MMAIDPAPDHPDWVVVSVQIARPQRAQPPSTGGSGSTSGGNKEDRPIAVVSREGRDVAEALQTIQLAINRVLFFGHLQALVIHEQVARRGLAAVLNPVAQSRVVRRQIWMFVSRERAEQVVNALPVLDVIPGMHFTNLFRNQIILRRQYDATIGGFRQRLVTPGVEPYLLGIDGMDPRLSAPRIVGLAVFADDRLVGWLPGDDYVGWALADSQFPRLDLTIPCPHGHGQFVVNVTRVRSRLRVMNPDAPRPKAVLHVHVHGMIEGGPCVQKEREADIQVLSRQVQQVLAKIIGQSIQKAQHLGTDVFGIGRQVYRMHPSAWHGDAAWRQTFPRLRVIVQVTTRLDYMQTYRQSALLYVDHEG